MAIQGRGFEGGRPFRRAEARTVGLTDADLIGPSYQRLYHGVYLAAGVRATQLELARAALHVSPPDSYVSHHTAAKIWRGIPPAEARTHVTVPTGCSRSRRRGIISHRTSTRSATRLVGGLPVSSPTSCFCELAASGVGLVDLVVLGDSLVKAGVLTVDQLADGVGTTSGRGSGLAKRAAGLVRDDVDSPQESRLRMLLVLGGLPEPVVNFIIRDSIGEPLRRFDLCYPDLKLIIEYDGDQHRTDPRQHAHDLERREELERLGWRFVVVEKTHIFQRPAEILNRVRRARLDRGAAASTCRIRTTWMAEFCA